MFDKIYHKIRSDEIHAEAVKDYHIATGEIHGAKIKDSSIDLGVKGVPASITDALVPTGEIHGAKLQDASVDGSTKLVDGSVITTKIADSAVTAEKIKHQVISVTAVPDVDTEVAHNLGVTPTIVMFTTKSTGVIGYLIEVTRSATSVTVRANTSGVDADIILIA